MARCRCGSAKQYKRCCGPLHDGSPPSGVEALMRSRYCAYARGLSEYIVRTTHPDGPHFQSDRALWLADVERFCERTRFAGLAVSAVEQGATCGFVSFTATLEVAGADASFGERSRFELLDGRWLYHSGTSL